MTKLLLFLAFVTQVWAQPSRIVSTFPSATETLFALGSGDRVVGVSNYCRYPPSVLSLPKVGSVMKPDSETIALLRPDLVIIERSATRLADRLDALHIRYSTVRIMSLEDVYSASISIARAASVPDRAEALNASIRSRLSRLQAASQSKRRPRVLMLVGRGPSLFTNIVAVGPGSYLAQLIGIAGGDNILAGSPLAYPHISFETILRLDPEVILDASLMEEAGVDPHRTRQRILQPWLSHREVSALRRSRVFALSSQALVTPGPRVVEAAELIRSKLAP